jgi:hypothetical protein
MPLITHQYPFIYMVLTVAFYEVIKYFEVSYNVVPLVRSTSWN